MQVLRTSPSSHYSCCTSFQSLGASLATHHIGCLDNTTCHQLLFLSPQCIADGQFPQPTESDLTSKPVSDTAACCISAIIAQHTDRLLQQCYIIQHSITHSIERLESTSLASNRRGSVLLILHLIYTVDNSRFFDSLVGFKAGYLRFYASRLPLFL